MCLLLAPPAEAQFLTVPDVTVVQGLVTEYGTGKMLSNITVSLTPARSVPPPDAALTPVERFRIRVTRRTGRTDEYGRFEIKEVDPGDYYILAERRGYIRPGETDPRGRLISVPDDTRGAVGLEILPGAVIEGHVFDEEGEPLRGVQVAAQTWAYDSDGRVLREVVLALDLTLGRFGDPLDTSVTSRTGTYRLEGLMPGAYQIVARRQSVSSMSVRMARSQSMAWPGTTSTSSCTGCRWGYIWSRPDTVWPTP